MYILLCNTFAVFYVIFDAFKYFILYHMIWCYPNLYDFIHNVYILLSMLYTRFRTIKKNQGKFTVIRNARENQGESGNFLYSLEVYVFLTKSGNLCFS